MRARRGIVTIGGMTNSTLIAVSNELADIVEAVAPSVVQVQGRRRSASGVVIEPEVVVTMVSAIGREDGLHVRSQDGSTFDAELSGWDPATGLAVLRAAGLGVAPARKDDDTPRVGNLAVAVARSWSNAVTASAGTIAVIGGPLPTGRRRSIERVIRTTARMHDGFAGGAFAGPAGGVIGIATATAIRGLGVVIPAPIAWRAASEVLKHGRPRRGYFGIAGQGAELGERQRAVIGRDHGLLVVAVTSGGPADSAGMLVGDVLVEVDGQPVSSTEDLLDLLTADRVGRTIAVKLLRGGALQKVSLSVTERTA